MIQCRKTVGAFFKTKRQSQRLQMTKFTGERRFYSHHPFFSILFIFLQDFKPKNEGQILRKFFPFFLNVQAYLESTAKDTSHEQLFCSAVGS